MTLFNETSISSRSLNPLVLRQCCAVCTTKGHKAVTVRIREREALNDHRFQFKVTPKRRWVILYTPVIQTALPWSYYAVELAQTLTVALHELAGRPAYQPTAADLARFGDAALIQYFPRPNTRVVKDQVLQRRLEKRLHVARRGLNRYKAVMRRLTNHLRQVQYRLRRYARHTKAA